MKTTRTTIWVVLILSTVSDVRGFEWMVEALEEEGSPTSVVVGPDDVVHVFGRANSVGMFRHFRSPVDGIWQREVLPGSYYDGYPAGAAVDGLGNLHVSFGNVYHYVGVYYRHFDGTAWSDRVRVVNLNPEGISLALDPASESPRIAVAVKISYGHHQVVYCESDPISGAWISTVVDEFDVGTGFISSPSMAIEEDGLPAICYIAQEYSVGELRYARFDGSDWTVDVLDTWGHGYYSWPTAAMALDGNGNPWIAYVAVNTGREIRVVHWDGSNWVYDVAKPTSTDVYTFGWDLDAAFSRGGRFHIAHSARYGAIQHAHWDGSAWQNEAVPTAIGRHNALAFDSAGNAWQVFGGCGYAGVASMNPREVVVVEIDIKPGSYPNAINLGSNGLIPVAILSSDEFHAATVDPETVELSGLTVAAKGKGDKYLAHEEDVNEDGLTDMVVQVATDNFEPSSLQDGYAVLTGETFGGILIEGVDEITIVPAEQ